MSADSSPELSKWQVRGILAAICFGSLSLHATSLVQPQLITDDFEILLASWTWPETRANIWKPLNEHLWPLMRLTASAIVEGSGHRQTWLPLLCAIPGRVALILALLLTYRFLFRHTGSQLAGIAGMIVFGLTAAYQEALFWFAAHPPLWCLCCALLGFLAADRWTENRGWWHLALTAFWSFVAPGWFAGGVLIGPLLGAYLALGKRRWAMVIPPIGTAAYLLLSSTMAGEQINHPPHFEGKSAIQSLQPLTGAGMTARAIVDQLGVAALGIRKVALPIPVVAVLAPLLALLAFWWWKRAADRRLVLVGLGFILASDLLIYSARAGWSYSEALMNWTRYNVYPWFGLMLMIVGGPRWTIGKLTRRQAIRGLTVAGVVFLVQLPRSFLGTAWVDPEQAVLLERLEELDRLCEKHHISARAVREVLPPVTTEYWDEKRCLEMLWGSQNPVWHPPEELKAILQQP